MAKKQKPADESAAAPEEGAQPVDRAVQSNHVKVRALRPLAEVIDGESRHIAIGATVELPPDRVAALGDLVKPV